MQYWVLCVVETQTNVCIVDFYEVDYPIAFLDDGIIFIVDSAWWWWLLLLLLLLLLLSQALWGLAIFLIEFPTRRIIPCITRLHYTSKESHL